MNGWVVEIEKLRAENDRLQAEANINMQEICRLRGREKAYLAELKDYGETVKRLRKEG